jgi:hypothetical protein
MNQRAESPKEDSPRQSELASDALGLIAKIISSPERAKENGKGSQPLRAAAFRETRVNPRALVSCVQN